MKDMEINFSITDITGENLHFKSLKSLLSFCEKEIGFWKKQLADVESHANQRRDVPLVFHGANQLATIRSWFVDKDEEIESKGSSWVQERLHELQRQVGHNIRKSWLCSSHPYINAFVECFKIHGKESSESFLDYLNNTKTTRTASNLTFGQLTGYIAAYEFENQNSDLVKRRKGERASLGKIRKDFSDSKDQLFGEVEQLKARYAELAQDARDKFSEEIELCSQRRQFQQDALDESSLEHQRKIDASVHEANDKIEVLIEKSESELKETERKHKEYLRLEPAAEYWNQAASRLRKQGLFFGILIFSLVIIGLCVGGHLFHLWLSHEKLPLDLASVQGILITATVLALYGYILRLLSRLTLSCFHLMRDAEEREQLTWLFLSLSDQSKVDEKSRDIVLQALFSRSETGLLSNEHGPSMPGVDVGQVIKSLR